MPLFCKSTDNVSILLSRLCHLKIKDWRARPCGALRSLKRARKGLIMKKTELQEHVREAHKGLVAALDGLSEDEATRVGLNENWSVKDALSHMAAWEIEAARIITEIQQGTWKPQRMSKETIDEFNRQAVESRKERSMPQVREEFDAAHREMERLIETLPEEVDESTPTYKYIESVTFKHFASHGAQIERWKKQMQG
jgi:hypothetical protein